MPPGTKTKWVLMVRTLLLLVSNGGELSDWLVVQPASRIITYPQVIVIIPGKGNEKVIISTNDCQ